MRLNLLGPAELIRDAAPVPIGAPKQRALLAMLAQHAGQVLPTDVIADRLWAGRPPASAAGSVQVYVSHLRRRLEPHRGPGEPATVLVSAADGYGLMTDHLRLDVHDFDALVSSGTAALAAGHLEDTLGDLAAALSLWRGDAYADVRHEQWARPEIDRLEQLRVDASEALAEAELRAGHRPAALARLERIVTDHPLRERAWELLALAHYRSGQRADALARLRQVRALLADELGIDPGPALRQLETAILRDAPELIGPEPPAPAVPPASTVTVPPPAFGHRSPAGFVGRADALAALSAVAADAAARGRVVLVDGEPGIGKTSLLQRFCEHTGLPVAWGSSPDHETAPALWPWEQVLRALAGRPGSRVDPVIGAFLSGAEPTVSSYRAQGARLRFFDAVRDHLAEAAPLVLVLDDLHAADDASLRLLVHVATAAPAGVLVVATFRSHEAAALTPTLSALSRVGAHRITLPGLTVPDVRTLVRSLSGTDPGEAGAEQLHHRTAGNPFFVTELAQAGDSVPPGVRDVVLHRVESLRPDAGGLLAVAAVAGDDFRASVIAASTGRSLEDLLPALDAAVATGLLQESPTAVDGYRFAHALIPDALLARRSRLWQARTHQQVAAALTDATDADADGSAAARIARHWLAAAELGPEPAARAVEFAERAAREAMRRHAPDDAAISWQEAFAAAQLAGLDPGRRADLAAGVAESYYAAGRFEEGYEAVETALELAGNDAERVVRVADIAMAHGIWLPFRHGVDPVRLRQALERAVPELIAGSPTWALAEACRCVVLAQTRGEEALEQVSAAAVTAAQATALAGRAPELLARVQHLRLIALRGQDFVEQRARTAERLLTVPDLPDHLAVIGKIHRVSYLVEKGQVPAARSLLAEVDTELAAVHDPMLALQVNAMHTGLDIFAGRYDLAAARIAAVEQAMGAGDRGYFEVSVAGQQTEMLLAQGRLGEMLLPLEEAADRTGVAGFRLALALALIERGQAGDVERAGALLRATTMPPRDYTWIGTAIMRLQVATRLADNDLVREMYDLLVPFDGLLVVSGTCSSIFGAYAGHLGEARLALGDVTGARAHLRDAVRTLEAAGADYWLARARQALAKCS